MNKVLYIYQTYYEWDVRSEKFFDVIHSMGLDVAILCKPKKNKDIQNMDIQDKSLKILDLPDILTIPIPQNFIWTKFIEKVISEEHPALVIVRDLPLAWNTIVAAQKYKLPVIVDMAENYPAMLSILPKYNRYISINILNKIGYFESLETKVIQKADLTFTVCEENMKRLAKKGAKEIVVLENIPQYSLFENIPMPIRNSISSGNSYIIGYVGALDSKEIRGFDDIIFGVKKFEEDFPNIKLTVEIIGEGQAYNYIRETAKKVWRNSELHMFGKIPYIHIKDIIIKWSAGIIPHHKNYLTEYTFPNKFYEYLFCGIPIICSDCAPLKRAIQLDDDFGITYISGNAQSFSQSLKEVLFNGPRGFSIERRQKALKLFDYDKKFKEVLQDSIKRLILWG